MFQLVLSGFRGQPAKSQVKHGESCPSTEPVSETNKFLIKTNKLLLKTTSNSWMSFAASLRHPPGPHHLQALPGARGLGASEPAPLAPTWCLREQRGKDRRKFFSSFVVGLQGKQEHAHTPSISSSQKDILRVSFFLAVCPLSHHVEASFEEHWFVQISLFSWFPSLVSISPPVYPVPNPRPWGGRSEGEKSTEMPGIRSPPKF